MTTLWNTVERVHTPNSHFDIQFSTFVLEEDEECLKKSSRLSCADLSPTLIHMSLFMDMWIHLHLPAVCVCSEGEQEEQWLADAGLSNLISEDSEDVDNTLLLSTLTRTQAEAVQRRLDSYTLSLRKKNKPAPRDVRDIFHTPISQVRTF